MTGRDFHDGRSRFFFSSLVLLKERSTRGESKICNLLAFGVNQENWEVE